ncbi:MAG TPA: N-6 DNA methylase [Flavobacterium sp.]|nr:N-6 DNA methylase [Flavobacterium sp.]
MSEELLQRDLLKNPQKIGKWDFYNIGATSIKALKEFGIIRYVDYKGVEKKKIDGLIVLRKSVIAVIEYKKPSEFKTKQQQDKAIKQEIEVARAIGSKLIIATDTKETVWVNVATGKRIKDEKGNELKINFDTKHEKLSELIEKINFSINENNDQIKQRELVNPTDLAHKVWQDIWVASGESPTNSLYTFVELFIFKYLSDLGVLTGTYNFYTLYNSYAENTEIEVLDNYATTIRPKIKKLFPESLIDKTTIINGSLFINKDGEPVKGFSSVFKKVLERFYKYPKLENIDYDFKSQLFESFLKEGSVSKKNLGQYFTPLKVVRAVVAMAKDEIRDGAKICDPACGVGKFLLEPIKSNLKDFFEVKNKKIIPKIEIHGFDKGFDKEEQKTIILAKANMLIYFSDLVKENPGLTTDFSTLFNESFILKTNSILGTLSDPTENEYDLILTNPPYVLSGSSNLKEEIKKDGELDTYYKISASGVEGLFMEWIVNALKKGGKAFVVIPDGILDRTADKTLRKFLLDECYIDGLISLPKNTFFTTQKKTYILCITKKIDKSDIQKDPVFTYLVSEIGESRDINRFDIDQNDLNEAVTLYGFFKGNKKSYAKINSDERCKIVDFEYFKSNIEKEWIIDKLWSKEEKIKLGILEEEKSIKLEDFPNFLEEISNNIKTLQAEAVSITTKDKSDKSDKSKVTSFVEIEINKVFDFPSIKGLTASFIQSNSGEIAVYGGRKDETPIGYIKDNLPNVKYFENCLSWNREGSVGFVFWHKHRFTTNDHHRPLIVKPEFEKIIDLNYMKFIIQEMLFGQGFSWSKTASKDKVEQLKIKIPVDKKGNYDLKAQQEISVKLQRIEQIKLTLHSELEKITGTNIAVD